MKLPQLSAKIYLAVFVTTMLGIYGIFHFQLYNKTQSIRLQAEHKTEQIARVSLQREISAMIERTNQTLDQLSYWDDLQRFLVKTDGFKNWYQHTLLPSRFWQTHYLQLQLYDENGTLIHHSPKAQQLPLPDHIPKHPLYFEVWHEKLILIQFKPIFEPSTHNIIGYIGLATRFMPALLSNTNLIHIAPSSLSLKATQPLSFTPDQLINHLNYQIKANPINQYLWKVINNFLIQIVMLGLLVSFLFVLLFTQFIANPLNQITQYIAHLQNSSDKLQPRLNKHFILKEFERLKNSIFDYHQQLVSANIEIEEQRQIAYEQARVDALSHVLNRRAFEENWHTLTQNYTNNPRNVTFLLFDCDFFKAINDTYGHDIGDEIIRMSASTLKRALPLDTDFYRMGGDEFAAVLMDRTQEESLKIAEKCYHAISNFDFQHLLGMNEKVVYSIGISFITPEIGDEIFLMNRQADIALYRAKKSLQHKICLYEHQAELEESVLLSKKHVNAIVESLQCNNRLKMHGQSIVSVNDATNKYQEALVRIEHEGNLITPAEILKVVEHRNLEIELDQCVLTTLLGLLTQNKIPVGMGLSINISVQTLLQGNLPSLLTPFKRFLTEHKLVIEILESTLITNFDQVTETLNAIRSQGFQVSLDDFGSGYSSIKYLSWMPVDIVKFDMSLTQSLLSDSKTRKIIESTANMIRSVGYDLVMEGIETEEMREAAIQAGATHLQGYLFDRPSPLDSTTHTT